MRKPEQKELVKLRTKMKEFEYSFLKLLIAWNECFGSANSHPIMKAGKKLMHDIRITNEHDQELVIIEIQRGSYLGEDDIVRLQDDYGRESASSSSTPR